MGTTLNSSTSKINLKEYSEIYKISRLYWEYHESLWLGKLKITKFSNEII